MIKKNNNKKGTPLYFKLSGYDGKAKPIYSVKGYRAIFLGSWRLTNYRLGYLGELRYCTRRKEYAFNISERLILFSASTIRQLNMKLTELENEN